MIEPRVHVLGSFAITADGPKGSIRLNARKAQELVSLLLLTPGQAMSREATAEALFPAAAPDVSRKRLRQALWHIHQAADRGSTDSQRFIVADGEHLVVNRTGTIWCDAVDFAKSVEQLMSARGNESDADTLERILDLYQGPLLDGCYAEWCLIERERLEGLYLSVLDATSAAAERRGEHEAAARWAATLLLLDPAHERSHRRLMRLYSAMGDRTRALRQFERCCRALKRDFGVLPLRRTVALANTIRDDQDSPDRPVLQSLSGASPEVVGELAALRRAVDELRRAVIGFTSSDLERRR